MGSGSSVGAARELPNAWEVRLRNLLWLREQFTKEVERQFPGARGVATDKDFADRLGINRKQYGHLKQGVRHIGNAMARRIEDAMRKPGGWLDTPHAETTGEVNEERELVSTLLTIYRADPELARSIIMRGVQEHLARLVPPRGA